MCFLGLGFFFHRKKAVKKPGAPLLQELVELHLGGAIRDGWLNLAVEVEI